LKNKQWGFMEIENLKKFYLENEKSSGLEISAKINWHKNKVPINFKRNSEMTRGSLGE